MGIGERYEGATRQQRAGGRGGRRKDKHAAAGRTAGWHTQQRSRRKRCRQSSGDAGVVHGKAHSPVVAFLLVEAAFTLGTTAFAFFTAFGFEAEVKCRGET